ncbi:MAG: membrane protein insertion efficiency factor YidD [Actinobacteria bacterium]|nr:membrane protein insertion efficiency factor YidD [Actinomycetota bacterium]
MAIVGLIRLYRLTLSGMLGGQCRFYPSCSVYGEEAVRTHGALRGSAMAAWRILRCGPFTAGGVDHVPPPSWAHGRSSGSVYDDVIHRKGRGDRGVAA